ncbi:Dual specificity phosphatase-like protein [Leptomonas seymouri]|uniref:protein-tyrosine-phosphatase n=1 Tax=Leptomonas seymouri TaxID=5684 RepID=A0A0N0P5N5_LEPSE|nr:Dual specificity phosphatase-like protein [Leptomonas seymouri]|eukprot:KPI86676.1 Dual specificity phosphatase-like protein [Leptomonas seymouri]
MASSVPQSATLPPPLHSPHSPYTKNRGSAFGSCFDDCEEKCSRRSQPLPPQPPQQVHLHMWSDVDRTDTETSSFARLSVHSSQPTTPCAETHTTAFMRGPKSGTPTSALETPPSFGKSKDARLACRQTIEDAYAPATSEASGDIGRPQKKELRLEECVANVCTVNRAVYSASTLSTTTTTTSTDAACAGGRDSSIFSFTTSMPDTYLTALPIGRNSNGVCVGGSINRQVFGALTSQLAPNPSPTPCLSIPTPLNGCTGRAPGSSSERSSGNANANEANSCMSRISKCKRRLQGLDRPAFDLKAVEEAQPSFLEEERVCNAAQCFPLSEITPLLCVGTWKDAANPKLLRHLGITYVLNVARELDPAAEANVIARNKNIIYESIPMSDCHSQDVGAHLRQAFEFIERARAAKSRVLVHCRRGISRSPAIVVGYLMASEHRSYEEALRFVTERRSCVSLNLAFQERLSEFVPNGEFFHGRPPSPAVLTQPSPFTETPGGALFSLNPTSKRSDQGGGDAGGGSGDGRAGPSRHLQHSVVRLCKSDDALPITRSTVSATSSNASSRASSTMPRNRLIAAVPSASSNFSCTTKCPRPAMHHISVVKASSPFTATRTTNSTCTAPATAFVEDSSVVAAATGRGKQQRSLWLEEDVAHPLAVANGSSSKPFGTAQHTESVWTAKNAPLRALSKPAMQPTGGRGGFADFRTCRSSDNNSCCSSMADTNQDEEEVEEPGSPFIIGNRRAAAPLGFGQPSSRSNASAASKKYTSSFSESADSSTAQLHPSFSNAMRGSGAAEDHHHQHNDSSADIPDAGLRQSPSRNATQASAFDDLADEGSGDNVDTDGVEEPPTMSDLGDLHKPCLASFAPRLSQLGKSSRSTGLASGSVDSGNANKSGIAPPVPLRETFEVAKARTSTPAESPSRGEESCSSGSHGNNMGTVGGLSTTPYGTQGSLNDSTDHETAPIVLHLSSLIG